MKTKNYALQPVTLKPCSLQLKGLYLHAGDASAQTARLSMTGPG